MALNSNFNTFNYINVSGILNKLNNLTSQAAMYMHQKKVYSFKNKYSVF